MKEKLLAHLTQHRWKWMWGLVIFLVGNFALIEYRTTLKQKQQLLDLQLASIITSELVSNRALSEETLSSAKDLLLRHPELHTQWDCSLALSCFCVGKTQEGASFAKNELGQKSYVHPLIRSFSAISLLIEAKKYPEAIQASLALEEKLKEEPSLVIVRTYNQLRLALLQKDVKRFNVGTFILYIVESF